MKAPILPPFLSADYCLRCCRNYDHREPTIMVRGGPAAVYNEIGIFVCHRCLIEDGGYDIPCAEGLYDLTKRGVAGIDWPEYVNTTGKRLWGFIYVARLDNGVYRVALHRHHAEVWSRKDVETIGAVLKPRAHGWNDTYSLHTSTEAFPDLKLHLEEELRFYDLAQPGRYLVPAAFQPAQGEVAS